MIRRLVAATMAALLGPSIAFAAGPHTLRFTNADDVTTLDPVLSAETTAGLLSQLTMAYLVRYDARNQPIPELVTVVPSQRNGGISADGRTITWHLRHDAEWSDGAPFDAQDVAFTVGAIMNPANDVVSRDGFEDIERVDTPDRYTSVFHLRKAYAAFLPRFFGSPPGNPCILPKHLLGAVATINQSTYNSLPVGIGPFRYTAWRRGDAVEMEANPTYFRGRPKLDRVVYEIVADASTAMTQLQAGNVDLLINVRPVDVPRARLIPDATLVSEPSYRFVTLTFNTSRSVVSDPSVRRALQMAVDRSALAEKVDHGLAIVQQSFVPPQYAGYRPIPRVPFDLRAAAALLERSGWKLGGDGIRVKDGRRLSIELATVAGAYPQDVELIRSWWTQIGVDLQTRTFDPKIFYQPTTGVAFGGRFDATIYSIQNFPFVYPSLIFGCNRIPPSGLNLTRWCDSGLDALTREYESTYDAGKRERELAAIAARVSAAAPLVVLDYAPTIFVERPRLVGFRPNAITFLDNMMAVDVR